MFHIPELDLNPQPSRILFLPLHHNWLYINAYIKHTFNLYRYKHRTNFNDVSLLLTEFYFLIVLRNYRPFFTAYSVYSRIEEVERLSPCPPLPARVRHISRCVVELNAAVSRLSGERKHKFET